MGDLKSKKYTEKENAQFMKEFESLLRKTLKEYASSEEFEILLKRTEHIPLAEIFREEIIEIATGLPNEYIFELHDYALKICHKAILESDFTIQKDCPNMYKNYENCGEIK